MKISIVGAGAMGCLYACMLASRHEVMLYDVVPKTVAHIERDGIRLMDCDGSEKTVRIPIRRSGEGTQMADLVILFVKDTASEAALQVNKNLIGEKTVLLSLQNGMGNDVILERFAPKERILLGTTKHNCVTVLPGVIRHSGAGITYIGSLVKSKTTVEAVVKAFQMCGIETQVSDSVSHLLWEKLFVNMTINPLTALLNAKIGVVATNEYVRALSMELIREAVAVAHADGERSFDATTVFEGLMKTAETLSEGKASMCQDLESGRCTEIDFINGAVVRLGEKYGVPTPTHKAIVALIHGKEALRIPKESL